MPLLGASGVLAMLRQPWPTDGSIMLQQRVITAVVLLVVFSVTLWVSSPLPFLLLTVAMIGAAGWEWMRLNSLRADKGAMVFSAVMMLSCWLLSSFIQPDRTLAAVWWVAAAAWVLGCGMALRAGVAGWARLPEAGRWVLGWLLLCVAWLALAQARVVGVNFLLSILCLVWVADIAAYFGGRAFGRRKLAPAISPGKSWEGVYSGAVGVMILAVLWLIADQRLPTDSKSLYSVIYQSRGALVLVASVIALTALSVMGDLFESLIKRAAGAKDSSQLLPGHGGVLDRIDALLPVLPVAMALASL